MTEEQFEELDAAAHAAYSHHAGLSGPVGIGIMEIVMAIISAIMGACKPTNASELKDSATNPSRFHQFLVNQATRQELRERYGFGGWKKHKGEAVAATVFELGQTQSVEMIAAACNCD